MINEKHCHIILFFYKKKEIKNDKEHKLNAKMFILLINKLSLKIWGLYKFSQCLGQIIEFSRQYKENYSSMKVTFGISTTIQLLSIFPSVFRYTKHTSLGTLPSPSTTQIKLSLRFPALVKVSGITGINPLFTLAAIFF